PAAAVDSSVKTETAAAKPEQPIVKNQEPENPVTDVDQSDAVSESPSASDPEVPVAPTSTQSSDDALSAQEIQKVSSRVERHMGEARMGETASGFMNLGAPVSAGASLSDGIDFSAGTYAPAASFADFDEVIDVNSRGSVVEV